MRGECNLVEERAMIEVDPKYRDHPMYEDLRNVRLMVLGDYLRLGAMLWAAHHGATLPLVGEELRREMEIDLKEFEEWLFGQTERLRVIKGGKPDG